MKINPQNELGDIISETCVNLNRFREVVNFSQTELGSSFWFRGFCRIGGSKIISMGLCEDKSTE